MIPGPGLIPGLDRGWSRAAGDPDVDRRWAPPKNNEWHGFWFHGSF